VIGCTTAYYLTHHPQFDPSIHSVTLIEAAKLANGASGKAGGLLAAWAFPNNLAKLSFDLHDELAQAHNGAELWGYRRVRCGQLTIRAPQRKDAPKLDSWSKHSANNLGKFWPREPKDQPFLPEDLDWFDNDSAQAYEELADTTSTAQVYPMQFTNSMARLAEQKGARIIMGRVERINHSDDSKHAKGVSITYVDKATSAQQTLPATTIVLAAGPWTPTLLPKVRMRPLRAHSVTFKLRQPVSAYCLFSDIRLTGRARPISLEIYPRPNNEVYICSDGDLDKPLPLPGNATELLSNKCQDIINAAMSVSDKLRHGEVTGRRACYLPVLDVGASNDPLIGHTELEGLLLATGHSCWGISNAPGTGKAISELVFEGRISCIDASALDPRRRIG